MYYTVVLETTSGMPELSNNTKSHNDHTAGNPAADLIRQKIDALYAAEPNASAEAAEVAQLSTHLSKHQRYMKQLTESGMSLAEIQTAWHNYYTDLPDSEKHEVWNEFYKEHGQDGKKQPGPRTAVQETHVAATPQRSHNSTQHHKKRRPKTVADVRKQLLSKASAQTSRKMSSKQHFQSLLFGVGLGSIVVLFLLFGFFNERFIAPFITPSRQVSDTPIIADTASASGAPKILIPKINVEIPVVYDEPSIEEKAMQKALERGVVHYATTPYPGEKGNGVIFGHSSNNILNQGKYKFAFVLLNRLDNGDVFYLNYKDARYAYRVYEKKVVEPTELSVLGPNDKAATMTLITCDPPGTSLRRLIVVAEQINPDPNGNKATTVDSAAQPTIIPSNAPSLWQRIKDWFRN